MRPSPASLRPLAAPLVGALLAVATLGSAACTGRGKNAPGPQAPPITVRVDNRSFGVVTIHAARGSQRVRLGQVSATASTTFRIPPALVVPGDRVLVTATPLASRRRVTADAFPAVAGAEYVLVVPPG